MGAHSFEDLATHVGHSIEVVHYANRNVAAECRDCHEVLIDFDAPSREPESLEIEANIHSDDNVMDANFDATLYFVEATDDMLRQLQADSFGGAESADGVAYFYEDRHEGVEETLRYCRRRNMGFEVEVNDLQATDWIKRNRPHLLP